MNIKRSCGVSQLCFMWVPMGLLPFLEIGGASHSAQGAFLQGRLGAVR